MLRYDTPTDAPNTRPVRKLLVLVLIMGIRDRAATTRFCLGAEAIDLAYEVDGVWYDLVPPPAHIWSDIRSEVRSVARLVRPDRGGWWNRTRPDDPETGWLTFRLNGHDHLYRVQLNASELILDRIGDSGDRLDASNLLAETSRWFWEFETIQIEFPNPGNPTC